MFKHKDHEIATWHTNVQKEGFDKPYGIHNQIDFIAIQPRKKKLLPDAIAYQGTSGLQYESDHALVVTTMRIKGLYQKRQPKQPSETPRDIFQLSTNTVPKERFAEDVTEKVQNFIITGGLEKTPQDIYDTMKSALQTSRHQILPEKPKIVSSGRVRFLSDIQIGRLVNRRHELRQQYTNTPAGRTEKRKSNTNSAQQN